MEKSHRFWVGLERGRGSVRFAIKHTNTNKDLFSIDGVFQEETRGVTVTLDTEKVGKGSEIFHVEFIVPHARQKTKKKDSSFLHTLV